MAAKPNVVLIMADDLGYGDLSCYGAELIQTPNIDRLAQQGVLFENYYTSGSVCTPTRYSMMAGQYPFRHPRIRKNEGLLLDPEKISLASVFKQAGYKTAAIGKWHLGYGTELIVDWNQSEFKPGPLEVGFDYHLGLPRNHNDTVRSYVENHQLLGRDPEQPFQPSEYDQKNRKLARPVTGLLEERKDDLVNKVLADKVIDFIRSSDDELFFVFFTPTIPHTHITPAVEYRGTSSAGQFGDFIQELDAHVGRIMDELEQQGIADNTIVIFTSDNGGQLQDHWTAGIGLNLDDDSGDVAKKAKFAKIEAGKAGHRANRHLRAGKASRFDGAFRVPMILRWPNKVAAGQRSDAWVSSPDYLMTFADLLDITVPRGDAGDSYSFAHLIDGSDVKTKRTSVVMRHKNILGLRKGDWKLIWNRDNDHYELFNIAQDPSETKDVVADEPELVKSMARAFKTIVTEHGHRTVDEYAVGYTLPEDAVVTYPDSNPLRDALRPVPETAVFKMEGWALWDPSVIKVDDTYHLFCSRWPKSNDHSFSSGWQRSHVIRATSKNLFGPYEFQEVVLHPSEHPWATTGIHNPKITKVGDRYLLYHLGIPRWSTGFAYADSIEGPWEPLPNPVVKANNPALLVHDDGSAYMVSKHKPRPTQDGRWDAAMLAHRAESVNGPYEVFGPGRNRLPYDCELEDPTIWWANDQYNVICTDWEGKVTGVQKPVIYYTSKDGINYELYSKIPVWTQTEPIYLENGKPLEVSRIERPQVYVNERGEVTALLVCVGMEPRGHDFIVIRPVDRFVPQN